MERKRMDQAQLAGKLGVSRSAVNAWINDRAYPQNSVGALEEVLGISLSDEEDRSGFQPVSDELRRLIAETLPGDAETQRRVIGLLEGTLSWPGTNGAEAQERSAR